MNHWHTVEQIQQELDQMRSEMVQAQREAKNQFIREIRDNLKKEFPHLKRWGKAQPRLTFTEKQKRIGLQYLKTLRKIDQ
jgi:hypothetical protein